MSSAAAATGSPRRKRTKTTDSASPVQAAEIPMAEFYLVPVHPGTQKSSDCAKFLFPTRYIHNVLRSLLGITKNPWSSIEGENNDENGTFKDSEEPVLQTYELHSNILREMGITMHHCLEYVKFRKNKEHIHGIEDFLIKTGAPEELFDLHQALHLTYLVEKFLERFTDFGYSEESTIEGELHFYESFEYMNVDAEGYVHMNNRSGKLHTEKQQIDDLRQRLRRKILRDCIPEKYRHIAISEIFRTQFVPRYNIDEFP